MKILLTGASGFLGGHVAAALVNAGHQVRGLSRRMPDASRRVSGVDYRDKVDVAEHESLSPEYFVGIDAVIHLVGIIQEGRNGQTFKRIQREGSRNVVARSKDSGSITHFLYMSAIGTSPDAPAEYSRTKYEAEEIVKNSGIPSTIFRPSLIIGKDGEFVAQMEDLIKYGGLPVKVPFPIIPVPGTGNNLFQPVFVEDLVSCVIKSLADESTKGQTYEIGGATKVSFNELITTMAAYLKVKKPMLHAPIPILRIAATVMETLLPKPPVTRDQLANLGRDNVTASKSITDKFGIDPLTFTEMMQRIYELK